MAHAVSSTLWSWESFFLEGQGLLSPKIPDRPASPHLPNRLSVGQKEPGLPAPQEGCRHSLFIQPGANSELGRRRAEIQTQFWFTGQTQPPSAGPPLGPFSMAYFRVVPGLPAPCVTFTGPTLQSRLLHSKGPGKGSPGKQGAGKCQGRKEGRERHGPVGLHSIRATLSPRARLVWKGVRLRPCGVGGDSDSSYAHTGRDSRCV